MDPIDTLSGFLREHQVTAYPVLYAGAFIEILVPFAFFVPGEVFFYAAGVLGAVGALNLWLAGAVLIAGGITGDFANYVLGRRYHGPIEERVCRVRYLGRIYDRGKRFVAKHGDNSVLFARFLGPAGWVASFLAGAAGMKPRRFALLEPAPAVIAISLNIGVGYGLGMGYRFAQKLVHGWATPIAIVMGLIVIGVPIFFLFRDPEKNARRRKQGRPASR